MTTISEATRYRIARWAGLIALAGLLAIATLPSKPRDASGDAATLETVPVLEKSTWHG